MEAARQEGLQCNADPVIGFIYVISSPSRSCSKPDRHCLEVLQHNVWRLPKVNNSLQQHPKWVDAIAQLLEYSLSITIDVDQIAGCSQEYDAHRKACCLACRSIVADQTSLVFRYQCCPSNSIMPFCSSLVPSSQAIIELSSLGLADLSAHAP